VRALSERIRPELPRASWTRPESCHLTLKFLGEVTAEQAERFASLLEPSVAACGAGELACAGPLLLPSRGRPRVLGLGFQPGASADRLGELARAAEESARACRIPAESRAWRPHVSLARVREPWPVRAVEAFCNEAASWSFPPWPVRRCVLYQSRLGAGGAVHTPLREWSLESAARGGALPPSGGLAAPEPRASSGGPEAPEPRASSGGREAPEPPP
jgi:2'-5' RNA ligase